MAEHREPKRRITLATGAEAAAHVAFALSDVIIAQPQLDAPSAAPLAAEALAAWAREGARATAPEVRVLSRAEVSGGQLQHLGCGAILTGSDMLRRMAGGLLALSAQPLPQGDALAVHVGAIAQGAGGDDAELQTDLADVMALRDVDGLVILSAGSVQEIHDMALVAHAVSARTRRPAVSFWDAARLSAQAAPARLMSHADLVDFADGTAGGQSACEVVEAALERLGYALFEYEGPSDAESVVVAMGTAAQCVADELRAGAAAGQQQSVGLLRVRALRPWAAAQLLAALPQSARRVLVLDQTSREDAAAPLFADVAAAFHGDGQWAAPALLSARVVVPASIGLAPAVTAALLANLAAAAPKASMTMDDVPGNLLTAPHRALLTHTMVTWATPKQGQAARSAMAVVLGPLLGFQTQSVESAALQTGVARCEVRYSPLPVAAEHAVLGADVIAVDDVAALLLPRCDPLAQAREGLRVLLNCPWRSADELARELPPQFRAALAETGAELWAADATALAGGQAAHGAWATQLLAASLARPGGADYRQLHTHFARVAAANLPRAVADKLLPALAPGPAVAGAAHRVEYDRDAWLRAAHGDDAADAQRAHAVESRGASFAPADSAPAGLLRAGGEASAAASGAAASAGEEAYHALMRQLFGHRLLVSDTAAAAAGGSVAQSVEASYGAFLAQSQARETLVADVEAALADPEVTAAASQALLSALAVWHAARDNAVRCGKLAPRLAELLAAERSANPTLARLHERRALLDRQSKWIVGGEHWAHDLSSNGIHHILRSGLDVNVIVFDHELYAALQAEQQRHEPSADPAADANTSHMSVFSTMTGADVSTMPGHGAPSDPAAAAPRSHKKDIGLYAMNYGTAYVASVSAGASQSQALRALAEADAFRGPSIILAHAPPQQQQQHQQQLQQQQQQPSAAAAAVDSGAWPLYRWNPANPDGQEFQLDSAKLQAHLEEFLQREQQMSILANAQPSDENAALSSGDPDDDDAAAAANARKRSAGAASLETSRARQHAALLKEAEQRRLAAQFDALAGGAAGGSSNPQLGLLVLYGSDGGNGSAVAEKLAKKAEVSGCGEVRCLEANDVSPDDLAEEKHVLFVLATAGQGEPCANAKHFCEALEGAGTKLGALKFAVFGLGDSHYWGEGSADSEKYFCLNARDVDARLAALGATRVAHVGLGDDQDDDGYEGALKEWEPALWEALGVVIDTSKDLGGAPAIIDDDIKIASNFLAGNIDEGLRDDTTLKLLPEDTKLTKFHGIYQQDLRSVREERVAAKQELAYSFMIRIGLPGGVASSEQYLAMDDIVRQYSGNQILKVTTRQAYQIHGVVKSEMKTTMKAINRAAMDTLAACGDVNRNVIGDQNRRRSKAHEEFNELAKHLQAHLRPVAGGLTYASIWLDKEIVKGTVLEEPIYGDTYLPRKFKIALAVNGEHNLTDVFAHCLGFIANMQNGRVASLTVTVGGGMGTTFGSKLTYPRLADVLGSCDMSQALAVAEAVVKVQRDHGERVNRKHARLKYTVEDMGLEVFRHKVEALCGFMLGKAGPIHFPSNADQYGWRQGYDGKWDYTLFVENGRIMDTDDYQLRAGLREIALANLSGEVSLTATQNVVIGAVPDAKKPAIEELLRKYKMDNSQYSAMRLHSMACVALPTCALAMAESQRYLPSLIDKLEETLDECGLRHDAITIRMTGCPNGCARPYVAEIAFVGTAPGKYHLFLGGGHAGNRIARLYRQGIDEEEVLAVLRPMLEAYARERTAGEHFGDFVIRKKIVEPVLHGRCFWVTDPKENDMTSPSGTTQIYW